MNDSLTELTNRWMQLSQETYRTYVKSLVWNQERALELTKTVIGQVDAYQAQGKGLVEEYTSQVQNGQQLWQEMFQDSLSNNTQMFNQFLQSTPANMTGIMERIDTLQPKVEVTTK